MSDETTTTTNGATATTRARADGDVDLRPVDTSPPPGPDAPAAPPPPPKKTGPDAEWKHAELSAAQQQQMQTKPWAPAYYRRSEMPVYHPGDDIVRGTIGGDETACIYGWWGSLKSTLALELARVIDVGGLWANDPGCAVQHRGGTLVFAGEGAKQIRARLSVLDPEGHAQRIVLVRDVPPLAATLENHALLDQVIEYVRRVRDECLAGSPLRLVVIDTLTLAVAGLDRNQQLGAVMPLVREIREGVANDDIGCAALLIAHESRSARRNASDDSGPIGDSGQGANVDVMLRAVADEHGSRIETIKQKDRASDRGWLYEPVVAPVPDPAYREPATHIRINWLTPYFRSDLKKELAGRKAQSKVEQRHAAIQETLADAGQPITAKQVHTKLGEQGTKVSQRTVREDLKQLVKDKRVVAIGSENSPDRTYRLASPTASASPVSLFHDGPEPPEPAWQH